MEERLEDVKNLLHVLHRFQSLNNVVMGGFDADTFGRHIGQIKKEFDELYERYICPLGSTYFFGNSV